MHMHQVRVLFHPAPVKQWVCILLAQLGFSRHQSNSRLQWDRENNKRLRSKVQMFLSLADVLQACGFWRSFPKKKKNTMHSFGFKTKLKVVRIYKHFHININLQHVFPFNPSDQMSLTHLTHFYHPPPFLSVALYA